MLTAIAPRSSFAYSVLQKNAAQDGPLLDTLGLVSASRSGKSPWTAGREGLSPIIQLRPCTLPPPNPCCR